MPKLISEAEDLVCNIWYNGVRDDWYYYRITLHWKGKPVINPDVRFPYSDGSPQDTFGFYHHEGDGLRNIFDYALSTGHSCAWDCVEPDISMAIYPGGCWPYSLDLKGNSLRAPIGANTSKRQSQKLAKLRDPEEIWTFMFFVDTQRLIEGDFISGDGIIMSLSTTRKEVERFRAELEIEHKELLANPNKEKGSVYD